jgi:DNA helicase-2/ATP-dependent DNA helicase PcrA
MENDRVYAERPSMSSVAKEIIQRVSVSEQSEMHYQWSDVAILVRANAHAEPFARALSRSGVPFQFLGPGQLYRKAEVKDLIAYLKVLYNFEDNVAMYRILVMDWMQLASRDVAVISNAAKKYGKSLFEICELITGEHTSTAVQKPDIKEESKLHISELVRMIHDHLGLMKKETAGQILYFFLERTGLLQLLAHYTNTKDETVALNISKFFGKLKEYESQHDDASVFTVVDWIEMSMQLGESPMATDSDWSQDNAVRIMTIHSSKGLEFPIVFLVNMVSQRFPSMERKEQIPVPEALMKEILSSGDAHEQEERRLCYVGMTRARDLLYLTAAKYYGEGKREKKLSPFIYEAIGEQATIPQVLYSQNSSAQLSFLDFKKDGVEREAQSIKQHISYISYSQLSSFQSCPLQYKYRYVIKIPAPTSAALSFGDVVHKTLQAFYIKVKNLETPSKQELLSLYDELWVSIGYGNKQYEEKMKVHGVELLSAFYEKAYTPGLIPTALEEPFKIKITPTVTLGGKIDRIDTLNDGTIEIIDYKTGTATKSRDVEKILNDLRTQCSQEGVQKSRNT